MRVASVSATGGSMRGRADSGPVSGSSSEVGVGRRVARGLARVLPLTPLGVLVAAGGASVFFLYGRPRSDFVVQLASAGAVAFVVAALLEVVVGRWLLGRRRLQLEDRVRFEAQRGFVRGEGWPTWWYWPFVEVRAEVEQPAGLRLAADGGGFRLDGLHRARSEELVVRWWIEDGLGLARWTTRSTLKTDLRVAPHLAELERDVTLRAWSDGEDQPHPMGQPVGDRVELRPYVRGDPLRLVRWKVYARTGELMVRASERALERASRVHAFIVPGPEDEAAAAAAWAALEGHLLGPSWRFGGPSAPEGVEAVEPALDVIAASRGKEATPALARFAEGVGAEAGARLLLFAPAREGPWVSALEAAVRLLPGRVSVLLVHDAPILHEVPRRRRWLRSEAVRPPGCPPPPPDALRRLERRLVEAGASVGVVVRGAAAASMRREAA